MQVTNRSTSVVVYTLDELKVRRNFAPNETKDIPAKELETLYQQEGGNATLRDYLMVHDKDWMEIHYPGVPIEYFWTFDDVKNCLENDSLELFKETLQYAPEGVLDIIKDLAWRLPVNSLDKMRAIEERTGFNVEAAIAHSSDSKEEQPQPRQTSRLRKQ